MELSALTIRSGTIAELDTFATFWIAMYEECAILYETQLPRDWRDRFVAHFTRRIQDDDARFFVACDGEIVGTAGAFVAEGYPALITEMDRGYIFGVRVAPTHRKRGLAEALTSECVTFLQSKNCAKIRLHASTFGRPIYERMGFTATNEMELPELCVPT